MIVLAYSLISVLIISLASLVGILTFFFKKRSLDKFLLFFISFSAGSLIGGAFLHLLPEALEASGNYIKVFLFAILGFCLFFVLEKFLRWRHCHDNDCETHRHLGWMNVLGDGVHNLLDGMIVFGAFSLGPTLGVPVALSIMLHEIPQELSDFGVLVYAGFSRSRALVYNFISALAAIVGVLLSYFLVKGVESFEVLLLSLAAGGFLYIAASDLIPELHKEKRFFNSVFSFVFFLAALAFMLAIKIWIGN